MMMTMMDAYSPIHSYAVGALGLGLGLHALLRPREEYPRFGLPLEGAGAPPASNKEDRIHNDKTATPTTTTAAAHAVSPFIYVKAIREATYGLALIGLEYQGDKAGATTLIGIIALAALGDGWIVWVYGGDGGGDDNENSKKRRGKKAAGHWVGGVLLGAWGAWRAFRAYGEWAAFHALGY